MKKLFMILIAGILMISFNPINAGSNDAPGIALEDLNKNFVMLSSLLKDGNIVLSFWSYDCVPCRKEMPELAAMAKKDLFKEKKVKLVLVYVEGTTEKTKQESLDKAPRDKAVEVLEQLKVNELCLLDLYGVTFKSYNEKSGIKKPTLPLLYLINQKKNIVYTAVGYSEDNLKKLEKAIQTKL